MIYLLVLVYGSETFLIFVRSIVDRFTAERY